MKNIPIFNSFLLKYNSIFNLFAIFISLFIYNSSALIKAQTVGENETSFYGNQEEAAEIGGEYIIFQNSNNIVKGLVYVQNSDIISCFQGNYDRQEELFNQVTFAYQEMGTGEWVKNSPEETMSLSKEFPYQFNYQQANDNTKELFNQCLNYFTND